MTTPISDIVLFDEMNPDHFEKIGGLIHSKVAGPQGLKGDTGAAGPQGVQGLKGDQGIQGDAGAAGAQGVQGLKGDTGAAGLDGIPGIAGPQGLKGDTGAAGVAGAQGIQGVPGPEVLTNALTLSPTKAESIVNGVAGSQAIAPGTPDLQLGFNAAGNPITWPADKTTILTTDSVSYPVAASDRYVIVNPGTTTTKDVVFPAAAAFPNRVITVRGPITLTGRIVTVKTAAGTEMTSPGGQLNTTRVTWDSIVMDDRAVSEATWISTGSLWKLINWTERKFYATENYSAPANASTFLSTGGVAPAAGQPYQIPAGVTNWVAVDGNYVATIKLPTTNNATGRFSVYASNSASFDTIIEKSGTDLPFTAWIQSPLQSMHFEWANGLWRWVPAPEAPKEGAANISAMVSNVPPTAILNVGRLYEITMPTNTDVRIRALVARQAYISSEGEYSGGSFTTTTGAIVNVPVTPIPADNNIHIAGEMNIVKILDVATNRIFRVTVWRMGAIAGNWSGWVEEISVSAVPVIIRNYASNAAAIADATLAVGSQYSVPVGGFNQLFVK
jgi:hypothetical protein